MTRLLGLVAFPVTFLSLALMLLLALRAAAVGAMPRARRWVATAGATLAAYMGLLLGVSLASRERVLHPGAEKFACDLDCDLAFSVTRVMPAHVAAAGWRAFTVTLRARSDARRVTMRIDPLEVALVNVDGRRFAPAGGPMLRVRETLAPGEHLDIALRFDVPADAREPRLSVLTGDGWSRFVIGDERSLFHRATLFALPEELAGF